MQREFFRKQSDDDDDEDDDDDDDVDDDDDDDDDDVVCSTTKAVQHSPAWDLPSPFWINKSRCCWPWSSRGTLQPNGPTPAT